jgi:tetratricopeptide (TPR) repeat protein
MMRLRSVVLGAGLALAVAGTGLAADSPAVLLERASTAFRLGKYQAALESARAAAQGAPRSLPIVLAHAGMAEFLGEFDEAGRAYAQAQAIVPSDSVVRYRVAVYAVRIGDYDRAVRELDAILKEQSRPMQLLYDYAPRTVQLRLLDRYPALQQLTQVKIDVLMEKGDLATARKLAAGYGIVDAGHDYCAAAREEQARGNRDEVFRAFRLAALGQPDAADCVWWYGQWLTDEGYMRLGRLMVEEGTRATSSAGNKASGVRYVRVRLGGDRPVPKRAEAVFLVARQRLLRDRDVAGAARLFDEAIRVAPQFARPYNYQARIAWHQGDAEAAVGWLTRAVTADPESWRSHRNLGQFLASLERWSEAETHLKRTVELFDDDAGGRLAYARALYALGRYDEYVTQTRRALTFAGGRSDELQPVAEFLLRFERWGPGPALPPAPDPHLLLGWNYD